MIYVGLAYQCPGFLHLKIDDWVVSSQWLHTLLIDDLQVPRGVPAMSIAGTGNPCITKVFFLVQTSGSIQLQIQTVGIHWDSDSGGRMGLPC